MWENYFCVQGLDLGSVGVICRLTIMNNIICTAGSACFVIGAIEWVCAGSSSNYITGQQGA